MSFLSSVVLSNINNAKAKARDIQRITGLNQLRTALEAYRSDFGQYPEIATTEAVAVSCPAGGGAVLMSQALAVLVPKYIAQIPQDPINTGTSCYWYISKNSSFYSSLSCEGRVTEYHLNFLPEKSFNLPRAFVSGSVWNPTRYCVTIN